MYFTLNESDYHGEKSDIGSIILKFSDQLYKETGLSLGIYMGPSKAEIDAYFEAKGMKPLLEEVLWKNMTLDERINKFVRYVEKIGGINNDLLIIDPYLFPRNYDTNYVTMLSQILIRSNCTRITVVTDKNNFSSDVFKTINRAITPNIELIYSSDFHDRYWIANKSKGFNSGTSLNGVGRKISSILMLEQEDVDNIINAVNEIA